VPLHGAPPGGYIQNAKTNPRSCLESAKVPKNEPKTNLNEPKTNPSSVRKQSIKPFRISTRFSTLNLKCESSLPLLWYEPLGGHQTKCEILRRLWLSSE